MKGIEDKPTSEMQIGKKIHSQLEEEYRKRSTLRLGVQEAMKRSVEHNVIFIMREVPVSGNLLYGLIDEAQYMPDQILIIDDKPANYPYLSNKVQVWGYCLAFGEQFEASVPIIAALRQRTTKEIYWQKEFTIEDQDVVIESTIRILDILNGQREPEPTMKVNKCKSCRLKFQCNKCLAS